jgi:hypothetical protein
MWYTPERAKMQAKSFAKQASAAKASLETVSGCARLYHTVSKNKVQTTRISQGDYG